MQMRCKWGGNTAELFVGIVPAVNDAVADFALQKVGAQEIGALAAALVGGVAAVGDLVAPTRHWNATAPVTAPKPLANAIYWPIFTTINQSTHFNLIVIKI